MVYERPSARIVYTTPAPQAVISVYIDPPLFQPPPVRVMWAPPPMLVETVPFQPYIDAVWTGGYWVWEGNWVWAHGRWSDRPRPGYAWVNPYYEHRDGGVIFVTGFWSAPGVRFAAPGLDVNISLAAVALGVIPGPRPIGPVGVFVPPPPGSRMGLIVPAPVGTAPAVVLGAPPVINEGMRVHIDSHNSNNTVINNVTNVTNVSNVTNVTVVAPASATANGQAVNVSVPAQAHLAAAQIPMVRAMAPVPVSSTPIAAFAPTKAPLALPPAQIVRPEPAANDWRMGTAGPARSLAVPTPLAVAPTAPTIQPSRVPTALPSTMAERANPYVPDSVESRTALKPPQPQVREKFSPVTAVQHELQRNLEPGQRPPTPANPMERERRGQNINGEAGHPPRVNAPTADHAQSRAHAEMPNHPAPESRPPNEQRSDHKEAKPVEAHSNERDQKKERDKQRERE